MADDVFYLKVEAAEADCVTVILLSPFSLLGKNKQPGYWLEYLVYITVICWCANKHYDT